MSVLGSQVFGQASMESCACAAGLFFLLMDDPTFIVVFLTAEGAGSSRLLLVLLGYLRTSLIELFPIAISHDVT